MDQHEKVRENRLRRAADRQGLTLRKSRRRDPRALDFGWWMIVDLSTNMIIPGGDKLSLDAVESYLLGDR